MGLILTVPYYQILPDAISAITVSSTSPVYPDIEGIYTFFREWNTKTWYVKRGQGLLWTGTQWFLYDVSPDLPAYYSNDDVATPDLVTTWVKGNGATFMVATGAGNALQLNGTWGGGDIVNGKRQFHGEDNGRATWGEGSWELTNALYGYLYWSSTEDVATPDLVSTWTIQQFGVAPPPTFTAPVTAGDITIL